MNSVFSTARSLGIIRAQNKVRTLQIMNRKNIPIPQTVFSINPQNIDEQIELLGGPPVIIKLQEGTQGMGVILAESKKSAKSILDALYNMNTSIMLQEFVEESNGEDIRAIVVGNKVVAAMKRKGEKGEFRSNIHRGGTGENVKLSDKEQKIALKAVQYLSLPVAGVDMIRSKRGSLLIEVNGSPGFQGVEAYTKVNVAEEVIKYIEINVRKRV
jgi:ribosomal protein S6--L-glutamate ligase